jgi:hypothetical protein
MEEEEKKAPGERPQTQLKSPTTYSQNSSNSQWQDEDSYDKSGATTSPLYAQKNIFEKAAS